MIKFDELSDEELRTYVLQNRSDTVAFHAYVDRMQQRPAIAIIDPDDWSEDRMQQILQEKQRSRSL